jgi:hypothetical protein
MFFEVTPNTPIKWTGGASAAQHGQLRSGAKTTRISLLHAIQVFALAGISTLLSGCDARVVLSNTSGSERGVLANGRGSGGPFAYQRFTSTTDTVDLGQQLQPSGGNDEVVAFESFRPPAITTPVTWTGGSDTVNTGLANEIFIPIKVWILKSPFATQRVRAINSCITTAGIWDSERMGLGIGSFDIVDATGNPNAANYLAFDCSKLAGIEADIGKAAGQINIYIVDTVDGGTGRGQACQIGSDFVALGSAVGFELASHETGHDFSLTHIDDLTTNFDQTNIMHSASNTRQFITEGQLFRAHLTSNSAINFLYAARPGLTTRSCPRDTSSDTCPPIQKRIWADGTFPPN